jgi:hypothetical protein
MGPPDPEGSDQRNAGQQVHLGRAAPVVNDQRQARVVPAVAGDADVVGVGHPGHGVQEQHVARGQRRARRHPLPVALEVADEVLDPAVIDARVAAAADARVGRGRAPRVQVHRPLQVDAGVAKRADDHIGAHPRGPRDVAAGEGQGGGRLQVDGAIERDLARPQQDVDRVGDAVAVPVGQPALAAGHHPPALHHPPQGVRRHLPIQIRIDAAVARLGPHRPAGQPHREDHPPQSTLHAPPSPQPPCPPDPARSPRNPSSRAPRRRPFPGRSVKRLYTSTRWARPEACAPWRSGEVDYSCRTEPGGGPRRAAGYPYADGAVSLTESYTELYFGYEDCDLDT